MPFDSSPTVRRRELLRRHDTLVLENAAGTIVTVDRGCLWITLERDPRDVILLPGMRFEIDRNGRTVIAAEEDSRLRLVVPPTASERIAAWAARVASRAIRNWSRRLQRRQAYPYY
ncbi:MAG TPA: DUF2917 domain-containing protein [Casimicrobiaceae bacterium]|nr:DUF2917 domain-containing protein [Casimicrobiaceae bacterium]